MIGPNGGGKTNLLDTTITTLRKFFLQSWTAQHPSSQGFVAEFVLNRQIQDSRLEPHVSASTNQSQIIEIEVEVTHRDIENIYSVKETALSLKQDGAPKYQGRDLSAATTWGQVNFKPGDRLIYKIVNDQIQTNLSKDQKIFLQFLNLFDIANHIRSRQKQLPLSTPILFLPTNRSSGGFPSEVALSNFNERDHKTSSDAATSKSGSSNVQLAIGRIATRARLLLDEDSGRAWERFYQDELVRDLTKGLGRLGYSWKLQAGDPMTNAYSIQLQKQDTIFNAGLASSGEQEILTYLFAIYGLNVRDALIVIDEPELHLHPRWQKILLEMFRALTRDTGNQFILATHSPVFVSPSSIPYISRIYSENQVSKVIRLNDNSLPDPKHLFSIINSQNNEKLFFTKCVILVEGITDRLFFDRALSTSHHRRGDEDYEIIEVGGKGLFEAYRQVLDACNIPWIQIADLDYAATIGSMNVKRLFKVNAQKIKRDVFDNEGSIDAVSLLSRMDEAIQTGNREDLNALWLYVKARQTRLDQNIDNDGKLALNEFITSQYGQNIFILRNGDLETYLPNGLKSKDLNKLIKFLTEENFWEMLPGDGRQELDNIIEKIFMFLQKQA